MTVTVFEYLVLIRVEFSIFLLVLASIKKIFQTLKTAFSTFPNTLKFIKHTPLRVVSSTLFTVFGTVNTVFRV